MKKPTARVVVMDSIAHLKRSHRDRIVVCGSHGGRAAGRYLVAYRPRAVVFNDAGVGKQRAGIQALAVLDRHGIAAAAVSAWSARIGEGWETLRSGRISFVNGLARTLGVSKGMTAKQAVKRLAA